MPIKTELHNAPPPDINKLLEAITWGSPGGVRYRLLEEPEWERLPASSRFLVAYDGNTVVGFCVLAEEDWGLLLILLCVSPAFQGRSVGPALLMEAARLAKLEGKSLAGTIESDNSRSLAAASTLSLPRGAHLHSRTFTRHNPQACAAHRATDSDVSLIAAALASQHHAWHSEQHTRRVECWLTDEGDAGVQIMPQYWAISSLGGMPSILDRSIRAALPLLGIHPRSFRFGTAHYWWGNPKRWAPLLEHVLWEEKLQALVITGDPRSTTWQELEANVSMGAVGALIGSNSMEVIASSPLPTPLAFSPINAL